MGGDRMPRALRARCVASALAATMFAFSASAHAASEPIALTTHTAPVMWDMPDSLGLAQVLRMTVGGDPALALAVRDASVQRGRTVEAAGSFDPVFTADFTYGREIRPLEQSERDLEQGKREIMRRVSIELQEAADQLREPPDLSVACHDSLGTFLIVTPGDSTIIRPGIACEPEPGLTGSLANILGFETVEDSLRAAVQDLRDQLATDLAYYALRLRTYLRQFGLVPDYDETKRGGVNLSLSKPFRNGSLLTLSGQFQSKQENYEGKRFDIAWGALGRGSAFQSVVGARVDIPVGVRRDERVGGALERASSLDHEAALLTAAHAANTACLASCQAYWSLRSAEQQLDARVRAARLAAESARIASRLAAAGRLTAVDAGRLQARAAETASDTAQAWRAVHEARTALATAVGGTARTDGRGPWTRDDWPAGVDAARVAAWTADRLQDVGLSRRADVAAAARSRLATQSLTHAAEAETGARTRFFAFVSYRGLHQKDYTGGVSGFLSGERSALTGYLPGPSVQIGITSDLRFGNHTAEGALQRAIALEDKSITLQSDLNRTIRARAIEIVTQLQLRLRDLQLQEQALRYHREAVNGQSLLFQRQRTTALDLVQAQERLTNAELQVIATRAIVASLVSRFQFEVGALLQYRMTDSGLTIESVLPYGFDVE